MQWLSSPQPRKVVNGYVDTRNESLRLKIIALTFAGALLVSTHAHAAYVVISGRRILTVETGWNQKNIIIKYSGTAVSSGCSDPNPIVSTFTSNNNNAELLQIATTALVTQQLVDITINTGECDANGWARVYAVRLTSP